MDILIKALQVIVALSLLIILHEGGHYFFAKLFKTRVEKFYLFFDTQFHLFSSYDNWFRRLIGKKPIPRNEQGGHDYHGTEYGIGWIPLGGYVKISGMIDESMDKDQMKQAPKPWEFRTKPAWQRLLIMLGGVIMNFITAFAIYSMILMVWGESFVSTKDMTHGMKFSEQAKADGFRDGDQIVGVDDKTFEKWHSGQCLRALSNGRVAHVLRGGRPIDVTLPEGLSLLDMLEPPYYASPLIPLQIDSISAGSPAEQAGITTDMTIRRINGTDIHDFNDLLNTLNDLRSQLDDKSTHADSIRLRTLQIAVQDVDSLRTLTACLTPDFQLGVSNANIDYNITNRSYSFFAAIPAGISYGWEQLTGYVNDLKYVFTKKGAKSMGGFVAIGNIFPSQWDWYSFWNLTALLSIMLGVVNVLPIPALDGGHALFAIYEIVTRRKPSDKFLERAQVVGMFILLGLLLWANGLDLLRLLGLI